MKRMRKSNERRGEAMADYTTKGHKLEHERGLQFLCRAQVVVFAPGKDQPERTDHVLSQVSVWMPTTKQRVIATLKAWLSVYDDEELLGQVEAAIDEALKTMAQMTPARPSSPPQGQMTN